jgi:hypothetical protein
MNVLKDVQTQVIAGGTVAARNPDWERGPDGIPMPIPDFPWPELPKSPLI